MKTFSFTFDHIRQCFQVAVDREYKILTCSEYASLGRQKPPKTLVNRVDIDVSPVRAKRIAEIFNDLGIRGTFFVRLHAKEYNPMQFEIYRCLKFIRDSGHEIGLHTETVDAAAIWDEPAEAILKRDLRTLETLLDIKIAGTASHGGFTGLNNLDFWKGRKPSEFGLLYEGYDQSEHSGLFDRSLYVSDSCWTYWKCYLNGKHQEGDRRSLGEHLMSNPPLVYSLIHPETYYDVHPEERI